MGRRVEFGYKGQVLDNIDGAYVVHFGSRQRSSIQRPQGPARVEADDVI